MMFLRFIGASALAFMMFLTIGSGNAAFGQLNTMTISVDKDSYTSSQFVSTNYGGNSELKVGNYAPTKFSLYYNRTFVHFDLSSIPAGKEIYSVKFGLRKSSGNTGTPTYIVRRVKDHWAEDTITHSNQPTVSTLTLDESTSYTTSNDTVIYDVTTIGKRIYWGLVDNEGFCIMLQNEASASHSSIFYSDESGTFDPYLEVKYYDPLALINIAITHESAASAADAQIDLDITGGTGGYTYAWKNSALSTISTDTLLTGVGYGLYHLEARGALGEKLYQSFLVGIECDTVTINYQPNGDYTANAFVYNAVISGVDYKASNYGNSNYIEGLHTLAGGAYRQAESYLDFNVWMDSRFNVQLADLTLSGNGHIISGSRTNEAEFMLVTDSWNENSITYNNQPTIYSTALADAAVVTTTNQNQTIDIIDFWNLWKQDNTDNFGMKFQLQDTITDYDVGQVYSSPNASSNRPSIEFLLSLGNPNPAYPCNLEQVPYAVLQKKPDASRIYGAEGKIKFKFNEEMNITSSKYIPMQLYDDLGNLMEEVFFDGTTLNSYITPVTYTFNDNSVVLDLTGVSGITNGDYYTLEVITYSGEKRYLNFIYNN